MQSIILIAIPAVVLSTYLVSVDVLPHPLSYSPSLVAAIAAAFTVFSITIRGIHRVRPIYWIIIVLIALHLLFGVIANSVQPGSVIIGGRLYLRTIPFFFLALAVFAGSRNLKTQFALIVLLSLVQLPIAAYQRHKSVSAGWASGDAVYGTLMSSGVLSLFLICVAAVLVTAYLRNKVSLRLVCILLLVVLLPTMINETKVTLFLIPLAILVPAFTGSRENRARQATAAVALSAVSLAIFVPTYDYFIKPKWGYGILDFLTMEGRVEDYLSKGSEVGSRDEIGRVDSLTLPLKTLANDPVSSVLGLGMGSVTHSGLGPQYSGRHFTRYGHLVSPTVSRLLWEVGWLGVLLIFWLMFLIYQDAWKLRTREDEIGILAQSWLAVTPIIVLGLFYLPLMQAPALGALYWYYSGLIAVGASDPKAVVDDSATESKAEPTESLS